MFSYRLFLLFLVTNLMFGNTINTAKAYEVCSCTSNSGVPHSTAFSSINEPYGSCSYKCVLEANSLYG